MSPENPRTYLPANRHAAIVRILKEKGIVRVSELSGSLEVAEMTIRRDLEALEKKGLLERTHGGAVYSDRVSLEPLYSQKSRIRQEEKKAIGRLAASLIREGDTVFVNSGSTTLEFLRCLAVRGVKIITNNPWAPTEVRSDGVEVLLTGGELRRESFTLVGETAAQTVRGVFGTKAVIGVDGFSLRYGITTPVQAEAALNGLMIEQTHGEVIVIADSSKFGRVSNFLTAPISAVNTIVTDRGLDEQSREEFGRLGIRVLVAEEPAD